MPGTDILRITSSAIGLRARYEMSGTDLARLSLRAGCDMPSTDTAFQVVRCLTLHPNGYYSPHLLSSDAMSSTDIAYVAMLSCDAPARRCPVPA
eukprot:2532214-Rhodomonas_salina.4